MTLPSFCRTFRTLLLEAAAVEVLSKVGSADSAPLLWDRLEEKTDLSVQQKNNLARGLMHARNWILNREELVGLSDYCPSTGCRPEVERALERWSQPRLTIQPFASEGNGIAILHYRNLSLQRALEKVGQLPRGTQLEMPECSRLHFSIQEQCQRLRESVFEQHLSILR